MSVSKAVSIITHSCLALLAIYLSTKLFTRGLQSICLQSCLSQECNLSVYKVVYQRIAIYLPTMLFTRGMQSICVQSCLPEDCNLSVYKVVYQRIAIYLSTKLFTEDCNLSVYKVVYRELQSICLQCCLPEDCNLSVYNVVYQRIALYLCTMLFTRELLSICLQWCLPENCKPRLLSPVDYFYDTPSLKHIEQHDHFMLFLIQNQMSSIQPYVKKIKKRWRWVLCKSKLHNLMTPLQC